MRVKVGCEVLLGRILFIQSSCGLEDNDPLTDDGGSTMSIPTSRAHANNAPPSSLAAVSGSNIPTGSASRAQLFQMKKTQPHAYQSHAQPHTHHASRITAILSSDVDDGVDSPTYDGDIESSSTAVARGTEDAPSTSGTPLASPILATTNEMRLMSDLTLSENLAGRANRPAEPSAADVALGNITDQAQAPFNPATSSEDEIQSWVKNIILESNTIKSVPINPPPLGRPVRVYADGSVPYVLSICPHTN